MKFNLKKIIIVLFVFFQSVTFASAQTPEETRLDKIEQEVWGFSYKDETEEVRLDRIEKHVFGAPDKKNPTDKRIEKITKSLGIETLEEAKSSVADLIVDEKADEGIQYPQIDKLESMLLGSVYKEEDINTRLERLEKKAFGAKQAGELAQRTDALNSYMYANSPAGTFRGNENSYGQYRSQNSTFSYNSENADVKMQLSAIENMVFAMDFSTEPTHLRLSRLENKIFQRSFDDDDEQTRISRIQAVATASKTAKYYDNNKFQKFAATGLQAASFLLMILAFIL